MKHSLFLIAFVLCGLAACSQSTDNGPVTYRLTVSSDTVGLLQLASLSAIINGLLPPIQARWYQVSGPTSAAIVDSQSIIARVALPVPGTYSFGFEGSDGYVTISDTISVSARRFTVQITGPSNVNQGESVVLTAFADPVGVPQLLYHWERSRNVLAHDPGSRILTDTTALLPGDYIYSVTVIDQGTPKQTASAAHTVKVE